MPERFLIVDDSPTVRLTLGRMLERAGVPAQDINEAASGKDALDLFHEISPSVVLMDIQMPGLDGLDTALAMLGDDPELKVVVMTAFDRDEPRVQSLVSMGAFDVLQKPVRGAEIGALLGLLSSEESGAGRIR